VTTAPAPERDRRRFARSETPLPTGPPFKAYVGNLPWAANELDVVNWFSPAKILLPVFFPIDRQTGRPKGNAYVEFDSLDDLKLALEKNNTELFGREICVDVATEKKGAGAFRGGFADRGGDRGGGYADRGGDRGGGYADRGGYSDRRDQDRGGGGYQPPARQAPAPRHVQQQQQESVPDPDAASLAARPKLQLAKRSVAIVDQVTSVSSIASAPKAKVNPFGDAKPREVVLAERGPSKDAAPVSEAPAAAPVVAAKPQEQPRHDQSHPRGGAQQQNRSGKPPAAAKKAAAPQVSADGFQAVTGKGKKSKAKAAAAQAAGDEVVASSNKFGALDAEDENNDEEQ